jgi:hypothetical protein
VPSILEWQNLYSGYESVKTLNFANFTKDLLLPPA